MKSLHELTMQKFRVLG